MLYAYTTSDKKTYIELAHWEVIHLSVFIHLAVNKQITNKM